MVTSNQGRGLSSQREKKYNILSENVVFTPILDTKSSREEAASLFLH